MASSRHFATGLALRILLLVAAIVALGYTFTHSGLVAARIVTAALCFGAFFALLKYVQRTNLETARFIEALEFGDFSQAFSNRFSGSGAPELGEALEGAMRRLRGERAELSEENRYLAALVDEAPTALLAIDGEGRVELCNKAARHIFRRRTGILLSDLEPYGAEFVGALKAARPGHKRLSRIILDDVAQRAMIGTATMQRLSDTVKVVTVQPIQGELNAAEIAAQTDLVRVLTHEIMNSMTPVTSLAQTAAALMREADQGEDARIGDARTAVETVAARAEGIMHFVESYRQFSRGARIRPCKFAARAWGEELRRLFDAAHAGRGVKLALSVIPDDLQLDADPELLSQVVLNLLKNGAEAAAAHSDAPQVMLTIEQSSAGRSLILVEDNGPGIAEAVREDIFLPFFTTKATGTGVGLSLARQIVTAHGGAISVESKDGGARFSIVI